MPPAPCFQRWVVTVVVVFTAAGVAEDRRAGVAAFRRTGALLTVAARVVAAAAGTVCVCVVTVV